MHCILITMRPSLITYDIFAIHKPNISHPHIIISHVVREKQVPISAVFYKWHPIHSTYGDVKWHNISRRIWYCQLSNVS